MKKLIASTFISCFVSVSYGQNSNYSVAGYHEFIDKNNIKSIYEYTLDIDSLGQKTDSIPLVRLEFSEKGYLINKSLFNLYGTQTVVNYGYNDDGYLTRSDTVGFGTGRITLGVYDEDTVQVEVKTVEKKVGNKEFITSKAIIFRYSNGTKQERNTYYYYDKDSKLILSIYESIENDSITYRDETTYVYNNRGLLDFLEIYVGSGVTSRKHIVYNFW